MTDKTTKKNIKAKLQQARVLLQEMSLQKSGKNAYAGFKYYELKDFMPAVNGIFNDLGICSNFSIEDGVATLEIMDIEADDSIKFTSPIVNVDLSSCADEPDIFKQGKKQGFFQKASVAIQSIGALHTYMKRYLYLNALEIVENDAINATLYKDNDSSGGDNVIYFGRVKKEISSKSDLKALEQYVRSEAENIKAKLDDRQKLDLKACISERKIMLAPAP